MTNKLRVGLVGYKFMGKAHSNALARLGMFFPTDSEVVRQAICGRDAEWVAEAARQFGYPSWETDWQTLVARDDIDIIGITAPSNVHRQIAIGAAEHGKHVFCEKPLALNTPDAREILAAVQKAGVRHQVGFNYRFAPAIRLAKQMIEEGRLGTIYRFRGEYLQDFIIDPEFPLVWRLDREVAGSGSLGDLGAHLIDLARYLVGEFRQVLGAQKTFIEERPLVERMTGLSARADESAGRGRVTVDDVTQFLIDFDCGAQGSIEATRFAMGHKNNLNFEINGSRGSLRFSLERINELEYYDADEPEGLQGFRLIQVTEGSHPYLYAWWPAGHVLGYEHTFVHEWYEFIRAIETGGETAPSFEDGMRCCQILDAVEKSAAEGGWVEVASI
ncbi:MAG: Gfo/Idh/MocA family oxidoreductase [Bacillota bacterium]|nr:Gfo/Idh/MocA family oxidoreductase [Bacillota bacterium]